MSNDKTEGIGAYGDAQLCVAAMLEFDDSSWIRMIDDLDEAGLRMLAVAAVGQLRAVASLLGPDGAGTMAREIRKRGLGNILAAGADGKAANDAA